MSEFVLSFVVDETLGRVVSLITDEITLAWNLKNDIKELQESLTMIRAVLQDAEDQQTKREPVMRWLRKLREVAYDAEDLFDEVAYENLHLKVQNMQGNWLKQVCGVNPFSEGTRFVKKFVVHVKIAHKVRNINELLTKINKKATDFGLQVMSKNSLVPRIDLDRVTDSVFINPIVGREHNVSEIMNLLNRSCHEEVLTIISIMGMGGLGKTALAQLVCQQAIESKLFDVKIWVCVSDNFDDQKILGEMLQTLDGNKGGITNKEAILQQLQKELERKKFLLVLDDVWDDISRKWDDLKGRLLKISGSNGSAIVVTTRSEVVASIVETSPQHRHELNVLSHDKCWSIIKNRVCGKGATSIPLELESIGKELAEKCKGVPLAAKVLGGMLLGIKREKQAWLSIKNNKVLNASDNKDNVEAILKLSFDHLPLHLKPCFTFCSMFPKDALIGKEQLIQLWMAEGFVEPCNGDVGKKYFNALLCSSFFQDVERDKLENIVSCKMHDLVHDLAMSLSKFEILNLDNYSQRDDLSCIRHMNVDGQDMINSIAGVRRKLRTLFSFNDIVFDKSWKLKNLRALNLKGAAIKELPSSIGEWKLLRFIDVSQTRVKSLPESITKLYNLQTLRFLECESLEELPREKIKNLISLMHLEFSFDNQMPSGLGRLTCLERLPLFIVGNDRGGGIDELKGLSELSGKLIIKQLEKVRDKEEANKANLREKKITSIEFVWSRGDREDYRQDEEVLEVLQPQPDIKSIRIEEYMAEKFPEWVMMMRIPSEGGSFTLLNNLAEVTFWRCKNCKQLPSLGNLRCLKYLCIRGMEKVEYIGNEFYGIESGCGGGMNMMSNEWRMFPALKHFSLSVMRSLIEWKAPLKGDNAVVVFPCLEELSIRWCDKLTKIPTSHLSSLVKLEVFGCNKLSYLFDELHSFPSLTSLNIKFCEKLTCIPSALQSFTSLEKLGISWCDSLTSIPEYLGKLTCLIYLEIVDCPRLRDFPEEIIGSLNRLKRLIVGNFSEELDDYSYLNSVQNLTSLVQLEIHGNYGVESLPEQLQCLTSLLYLSIESFDEMEALPEWLGDLSSLESLEIKYCENLKKLPAATSMKRLSKIRHFGIYKCPHLKESFINQKGSEWDKISHIPYISFDFSEE